MKGRRITLIIAVLLLLAFVTGACGTSTTTTTSETTQGGTTTTQSGTETTEPEREHVEISVFRSSDMSQTYSDTMFVDYVFEKFNLTLNYTYVPSSVAVEKLNLSFATNTYDDKLEFVSTGDINRLAKDDFVIPLNDYMDQLENYRAPFTDDEWKTMIDTISDARGRFYALPVKDAKSASSTYIWMFRNEQFTAVGKPVPTTVDELYDGLTAIKAELNSNLTLPNRWGLWNVFEGFNLAFRTRFEVWKDPDAGNEIVFGAATDKFRDLLVYMNKLYSEGILAREFITMTGEQRMSEFSQGNVYANFQFAGYENSLNSIAADAGLPQDWRADEEYLLLSAYPDKGPMQQRWPAFLGFGVALTDKLEGERLDRALEFINWSCSEEGQMFREFGIEGESYEIIDGKPTFIGKYLDENNPAAYFGLLQDYGPFGYYVIQNEDHAASAYPGPARINEVLKDVEIMDYSAIPYRFTPEEEARQADLGTVLNQIRDEYLQSFVMGPDDPNSDADWNKFINELKAAGLDEYLQILRDANARIG